MSRTRFAHGSLTALAAAISLLTAGCSGTAAGAQVVGCRENGGWSAKERAQWLRPAVSFDGDATGEQPAVVIRPRGTDDGGRLCEPFAVQTEFWRLTTTAAGTELTSALRVRGTTGREEDRRIGFPPGLSTGERGACTGVLLAVYPGARLAGSELPDDLDHLAGTGTADVTFRTDRISAYRLIPPSDPERCGADTDRDADTDRNTGGKPTTAPPTTANPWGLDHP